MHCASNEAQTRDLKVKHSTTDAIAVGFDIPFNNYTCLNLRLGN